MSNGNAEVIREMKLIIQEGKKLDVDTRDRLLITAIIDIYETLEKFKPVFVFYQLGVFFASAIGVSVIGYMVSLMFK